MQFLSAITLLFVSVVLSCGAAAVPVEVQGLRFWQAPDHARFVFDLTAPAQHKVYTLPKPRRLVVELPNARAAGALQAVKLAKSRYVNGVETTQLQGGALRVAFALTGEVVPKSFLLGPNRQYGHRLVVDLFPRAAAGTRAKVTPKASAAPAARARAVVVAIDAGHGGQDPGAIGSRGTREKDVTLAMARELAALVAQEPGMRAVLTRDGDYYVGLRQRAQRARKQRADLMVSIHADAFQDRRARGSSVFAVSERGASSEAARWLADKENASDLVGGVSLDDKDALLAEVLLDLSKTATIRDSLDVGSTVLRQLGRINTLHKGRVEQAGFVVLKSPDIPSILVETAFISNPEEERKLTNQAHQRALAQAILKGIRQYFVRKPPPGTLFAAHAATRHVIAEGETLSLIAARYQVSVDSLRRSNGLADDLVKVGQVLEIPAGGDT